MQSLISIARRSACLATSFLRQLYGEVVDIMLCRVDGREAFRQVLVDPWKAFVFGYVMRDVVVVD